MRIPSSPATMVIVVLHVQKVTMTFTVQIGGVVSKCTFEFISHYICALLRIILVPRSAYVFSGSQAAACVVPYMYLQCVYVFCDAFNGSNKAVQTAVICGVGSPVAQASARATVERTLLRLQELPSAKGLAGKWDISSLEQFAKPFGGLGS